MLEQVGVGGHEDGGGPASRDNSFYHQLHLHHHHQQQQQQQQQQTLSEASLRMVLEETVHIDEAAGDTVRILSFCDVGCIVAVTSRSDDTTDLFYWRGDEYLRRLISVNHWRVTSASMNTRQTLLAFGLADELRQDHFFKLISLGTHMEEFDVDECKWTTSQHAYVNLHFMEASHGCDSLVVTHLTNSLCANTDPTRSSSNASDSSSNLWVYNIFSDLDELGEPIIDFEKLASPWEYDRNVLWYQFDRPTNMFYCIECCDPETHLLRSGGSSGVGDDDDDEGGGDGRNGDDEMFPTNDGTLPAGESPEVEFHFSAVHCTYGQLQRTVSLRLPDCISSHLQVAISGPFSHTPACDASLFEHAAIQVVDLGHGALCLAVQDHHRYAVYCAHWQCVLSSGFDVDPASQQLSRMIFLGLNDYVLAVLPGCAVHYWNCGSKHEPLEPFALPCDPLLDAQLHNAYSIRMKKSTTQALIVTSDLEFPIPVALSRKAICSLLLNTGADAACLRRHLIHCLLVNMSDSEDIVRVIRQACKRRPAVLDYAFLRETFLGAAFSYYFDTVKDRDALLSRFLPITDVPIAAATAAATGVTESGLLVHFVSTHNRQSPPAHPLIDSFPLQQRPPSTTRRRIDFARTDRDMKAAESSAAAKRTTPTSKDSPFLSFFKSRRSAQGAAQQEPALPPAALPFHERALMWHLRDEPKDAALETQKKQYLYALQVRTNHIVNACEALEKQCSPTCHPAIFNLLEKTLFVLKQLQFPVPERLHATLARLGFDVLPRPLFVQYLDTGIFQIDKEFVEAFLEADHSTPELVHFFVQRLPKADRDMLNLDRVWKHDEVQRFFTQQQLQQRRRSIPAAAPKAGEEESSAFLPVISAVHYVDRACNEDPSTRTSEHQLLLRRVASACTLGLPHAMESVQGLLSDMRQHAHPR